MTEEEFINITNFAQLNAARGILNDIMPEFSEHIPDDEFKEVYGKIWGWIDKGMESLFWGIKNEQL